MRIRVLAAAAALLVVAGCGSSEPETTKPTFGGDAPTAAPGDLAAAAERAGIRGCPSSDGRRASGDAALPDVSLPCLRGGDPVRLAGVTGTPTVINLWASWCAPCRSELPLLARADEAYGDRVRFVGIDFKDDAPEAAIELARRSGVTYPQLVDRDQRTVAGLKVVALPQTVFVDADGTIVSTERKAFDSYAELTAAIDKHLGVSR